MSPVKAFTLGKRAGNWTAWDRSLEELGVGRGVISLARKSSGIAWAERFRKKFCSDQFAAPEALQRKKIFCR
jgi:hypothetical protein